MRPINKLRSLAAQLSIPTGRAIALMRAIEENTTESLSDPELVDRARKAAEKSP